MSNMGFKIPLLVLLSMIPMAHGWYALNAKNETIIDATSTVQCDHLTRNGTRTWCVYVAYLEEEFTAYHEYVGYSKLHCSKNLSQIINVKANYTGGDGFANHNYDPMVYFYHNCTVGGVIRRHIHRLPFQVHVRNSYVYHNYNISVCDRGDLKSEGHKYRPNTRIWSYPAKQNAARYFMYGETIYPKIGGGYVFGCRFED